MMVEISCVEVWQEISNYIDDALEPELRSRMEAHFKGNRSRVLPDRDSDCRLTKQVRRYIGAGQFGNHESPYAG